MVSTRQSSNVGSGSEGSGAELSHHGPSVSSRSVRSSLMNSDVSYGASSSTAVASTSSSNWPQADNSCQEVTAYQSKHDRGLLDVPPEILEKIFGYMGYQKVSQLRLVCKQLDQVCCNILNSTFQRLQTTMLNLFQTIRAKMPRRESARRNHPLACESDIVETLHMRLTLLQMTFGKHIERKHCCFFAGEILDEVYRILHYIKVTPKLSRPYKITDELFDLSSMAMEYFKEHIEPTLPEISCFGTDFLDFSKSFSDKPTETEQLQDLRRAQARARCAQSRAHAARIRMLDVNSRVIMTRARATEAQKVVSTVKTKVDEVRNRAAEQMAALRRIAAALQAPNKNYLVLDSPPHEKDESPLLALPPPQQAADDMEPSVPQSNMVLRKRIRKIKQGMKRYNSQLGLMRRDLRNCKSKIGEQQKLLLEYATRLDDNDKKNEETSRKFSTLLQELNKCKTELQFWRSKTVANPLFCQSCGKSVVPVAHKDLQALAGQGDALLGVGGTPAAPFVFQGDVAPDNTASTDEDPFHSLWAADMNVKKEVMSACGSGTCREPPVTATMPSASTSTNCNVESAVCAVDPLLSDSTPSPRASSSATKRKASADESSSDTVAYDPKKLRRSTQSKLRATKRAAKV